MTLEQLQAKRDEILSDIDTQSLTSPSGASKSFLIDKQRALALLDAEIAKLSTVNRPLRRTVIQTSKGC